MANTSAEFMFRKVASTIWTGETGRDLRRRGIEGLPVALYLMTSPMSNMIGIYTQPVLYMAHETGLGIEGALKGLQDCIEVGFCSYDEKTETVWVHEMARWQIADSLKREDKRCAGIQKAYDRLPPNPFLGPWFDRYAQAFHLKNRRDFQSRLEAPSQAPPKPGAGAGTGAVTGTGNTPPLASLGGTPHAAPEGASPAERSAADAAPPQPAIAAGAAPPSAAAPPPAPPAPPPVPTPAPPPRKAARKAAAPPPEPDLLGDDTAHGTRLPATWSLPKAWGDWSLANCPGWNEGKVRTEAERFADHWHGVPGKDGRKANWFATWRNWCRNPLANRDGLTPARAGAAPRRGSMPAQSTEERNAEARRLLGFAPKPAAPAQGVIDA